MPKSKLTTKQQQKLQRDKAIAAANAQQFSQLQTHPDRRTLRKKAPALWKRLAENHASRHSSKCAFVASVMIHTLRANKLGACAGTGCSCHSC